MRPDAVVRPRSRSRARCRGQRFGQRLCSRSSPGRSCSVTGTASQCCAAFGPYGCSASIRRARADGQTARQSAPARGPRSAASAPAPERRVALPERSAVTAPRIQKRFHVEHCPVEPARRYAGPSSISRWIPGIDDLHRKDAADELGAAICSTALPGRFRSGMHARPDCDRCTPASSQVGDIAARPATPNVCVAVTDQLLAYGACETSARGPADRSASRSDVFPAPLSPMIRLCRGWSIELGARRQRRSSQSQRGDRSRAALQSRIGITTYLSVDRPAPGSGSCCSAP